MRKLKILGIDCQTMPYHRLPSMLSLTIILGCTLLSACNKAAEPVEPIPAVITLIPNNHSTGNIDTWSGKILARNEVSLSFQRGGKLVARPVNVGDVVKKGALIARINPEDAQLGRQNAVAQIATAESDVNLARSELQRSEKLLDEKFVSQTVLDARQAQLNAAEARLKQSRSQLSLTNNQLAYTQVHASTAGIITEVSAEIGQVVAAGQAIAKLAASGQTDAIFDVSENQINLFRLGDALTVSGWSDASRTTSATVRELAPLADAQTGTFRIRLSLSTPDTFKLGSTVTIARKSSNTMILLPLSAIDGNGSDAHVWTVGEDNKIHHQAIVLGKIDSNGASISSGINGTERIVIAGLQRIKEGMLVRVLEKDSPIGLDIQR